jgi:hypothetical protein
MSYISKSAGDVQFDTGDLFGDIYPENNVLSPVSTDPVSIIDRSDRSRQLVVKWPGVVCSAKERRYQSSIWRRQMPLLNVTFPLSSSFTPK